MTGFELVAGIVALFFACGILTGVLGVMALSAIRDHRGRAARRRYPSRYAPHPAETVYWIWPRHPSDPGREDWPGREELRRPDEIGELPPSWPSGRRDLTGPGD